MFLFLAYRIDQMESNVALRSIGYKCANVLLNSSSNGYSRDNIYIPREGSDYDRASGQEW
jgi:hypothetical protein